MLSWMPKRLCTFDASCVNASASFIVVLFREELREKERGQRGLNAEKQSLEAREEELRGHVQDSETALQADRAKIAHSGDNTELGALRLEREFVDLVRGVHAHVPLLIRLAQIN